MRGDCLICFDVKKLYALPCSKKHKICDDCYKKLRQDNCPYCRKPFKNIYKDHKNNINININIEIEYDPEPWLELDRNWLITSRTDTWGEEQISLRRKDSISWRKDDYGFEIKRRRKQRRRLIN